MSIEPSKQTLGSGVFAHAVGTLELEPVLANICARCHNRSAGELIKALRPGTDRARIEESLLQIADTRAFQELRGRLSTPDTSARQWLVSGGRESIPAEALLEIAAVERSAVELRKTIDKDDLPLVTLRAAVECLHPHPEVIEAVKIVLERDGSIKDGASPKLKRLRGELRKSRDRLRTFASRLARSFGSQDDATFSGSRYMLVVPRDKCRRKEGIVHSTSHSGESLYFEPLSLVEKNNALETLVLDVAAEERRILAELSAVVQRASDTLLANMEVVDRLDALGAMADFATEFRCVDPISAAHGTLRLVDARHPLLELSLRGGDSPREPVPLNLQLDENARIMVITGPNAGGKTVALKTVGLLVLMYQSGLPVPCAEGTELAVFDGIHADIGDEQSIESSLSTFTSHLRHLDTMCRSAGRRTLCLIDEIGDGTDPDEGAALAIASLEHLQSSRSAVIATTHYGRVKSFALRSEGVANASMVFDDDNDRPLYRLLQGTAGRSRGLETARRLDFFEPVIERARAMVGEEAFRLEHLLSGLEVERLAVERERHALQEQSQKLRQLIESYDAKVQEMEKYEGEQREKIKREAEEVLLGARREIEAVVKQIRESDAARQTVRSGHRRIRRLQDELKPVERAPAVTRRPTPGDRVSLSPSGRPSGLVLSLKGDRVTVEIGGKTITTRIANLYLAEPPADDGEPTVSVDVTIEPLAATEVDVRGKDREEALAAVDRFVDTAVLSAVREITVIHGVGEGVLQSAIRKHLKNDPRIRGVRSGSPAEGGAGVTIAKLE